MCHIILAAVYPTFTNIVTCDIWSFAVSRFVSPLRLSAVMVQNSNVKIFSVHQQLMAPYHIDLNGGDTQSLQDVDL
jgi:hypothetical protein